MIYYPQKKGIISRNEYPDRISFKVHGKAPENISCSYSFYDDKKIEFTESEGDILFSIPTPDAHTLLIKFDGKPALGYVIE